MRDFLPEYQALQVGKSYCGLYRLFEGARWQVVREKNAAVRCNSASEAVGIAKDRVRQLLNNGIRSERDIVEEDALGIKAWKADKKRAAHAERVATFGPGADKSKTLFLKGGKQVAVQYQRKRS